MPRGGTIDRRRILAAAALTSCPPIAAAAADAEPERGAPVEDLGLFGDLADLATAERDPLAMLAALRALLWSTAPEDREAVVETAMFQELNRQAQTLLANHPDLAVLAEPLGELARGERSAPQYLPQTFYILPREVRPFEFYPDAQGKNLMINLRATAMRNMADRRSPVVEVSLRQGDTPFGTLPLRSNQLSVLQSARGRRPNAPFVLLVANRCDATLQLTYVCIQGARS